MKTSLSRSIVKFFHNIVFSKKAFFLFVLITSLVPNSHLRGMFINPATAQELIEFLSKVYAEAPQLYSHSQSVAANLMIIAYAETSGLSREIRERAKTEALKITSQITLPKPVIIQNPNPNTSCNGGSYSLSIPLENPLSISIQNPVIVQFMGSLAPPTDVAQTKTNTQKKSDVVVEQSTATQEQQAEVQTQTAAAAPATEAAQLKAIETQASGNTQTGSKLGDPVVTFIQQQQKVAKEKDRQASTEIQDFVQSGTTEARNQHPKVIPANTQIQQNPTLARLFDHTKSSKHTLSKLSATEFQQKISAQWQSWGCREFKDEIDLALHYWSYYQYPGFRELIRSYGTRYEDFVIQTKDDFWDAKKVKKNKSLIRDLNKFEEIEGIKSDWKCRPISKLFNKGWNAFKKWFELEEIKVNAQKASRASADASSEKSPAAAPAVTPVDAVAGAPAPGPEDPKNKDDKEEEIKIDDQTQIKRDHNFSKQHKRSGIYEKFGPTDKTPTTKQEIDAFQDNIIETFKKIVQQKIDLGELKTGWNRIQTKINGFDAEIRAEVKNGKVLSIDGFPGHSARQVRPGDLPILKAQPITTRVLPAVAVLPQNTDPKALMSISVAQAVTTQATEQQESPEKKRTLESQAVGEDVQQPPAEKVKKSDEAEKKDASKKQPAQKKSKSTVKKVKQATGKAVKKAGKETGKAVVKVGKETGRIAGKIGTKTGKVLRSLKLRGKKKATPQTHSVIEPKSSKKAKESTPKIQVTVTAQSVAKSSAAQQSLPSATVIMQNAEAEVEKGATSQAAAAPANPPAKQTTEQQQSPGEKRTLGTQAVGEDVQQPPTAKVQCHEATQSSGVFDARQELARQMEETYRSDPSGFKRILKEAKKAAAPVIQRHEEQQAAQTRSARYTKGSGRMFANNTGSYTDFSRQRGYPSSRKEALGQGVMAAVLLNPEIIDAAQTYTAKVAIYLTELSYTSSRDLITGRSFSYLFGNPVESDVKAQSLEYLSFENACINDVNPYDMIEYERITSWKLAKHIKATFERKIRELNERKQKFEKAVNDALAFLQLPPKNIEEIQKNTTEKLPDLTGAEASDDPRVIQKAIITNAHEVCTRYLRRIECAKTAKKAFDTRNFNESEQKLREAILLYNEERPHWLKWRDNHAIMHLDEKITKEYLHVTEKYKPDAIKAFTGTHFQHIFHNAIVQEFNTCLSLVNENSYSVFGNCTIFTLEYIISALLDIAEQCNIKNKFYKAICLIKACQELNLLAKELSEINKINDKSFMERLSFACGSLFSLESGVYMDCEIRFGPRFKKRIEIKGEPWITTPPHLDQIAENLSLALISSFNNPKDLIESFLPQVIKLFKDLETKQPDSPENASALVANTLLFGNDLPQQIDEQAKKIHTYLKTAVRREYLINKRIDEIQATAPIKTIIIKTLQNLINKVQTGQYKQQFEESQHQPEPSAPQAAPQQPQPQEQGHDVEMQEGPQDPEGAANCAGSGQGFAAATADQAGATDGTEDAIMAASQANMEELPRPERVYMQQASRIDQSDRTAVKALIIQCDEINKTIGFDETIPNTPSITQLPALYQFYEGLQLSPEYSNQYGELCGYYAAHFAKIFAANPHATYQELVELLNDRNAFEAHTLTLGKQIILTQREPIQQVVDLHEETEGNFSDLHGNEIEQLLPHCTLDRTIVIGNAAKEDALHNEKSSMKADRLTQGFKSGQIDYLIYILPTVEHNHWVTVIARREANQHVHLILADSVGMDRRSMEEITNVYKNLVPEVQQAAERLAARIQAAQRAQRQEQHPGDK